MTSEKPSPRKGVLEWLQSGLPNEKDQVLAGRAGKFFLCIGLFLIVLWLGASHPVSPNTYFNIAYHILAFVVMLVLWVALTFIIGGVVFKLAKNPAPWVVFVMIGAILIAVTYARLQVDNQLRMHSGADVTIEDFPSGNSR